MELVCARHGRTAWNADLRFQGHANVPLDAHGRGQALLLAAQLRETPLHSAVSSDLDRCVETAKIALSEHPGVPLRLDPDLREMDFGAWEGLTWAQIVKADPRLGRDGWARPACYAPPGGETFESLVARVSRALARIRRESPRDGAVLLVTHAGVLHALLRVILGEKAAERMEVRFVPGAVTRFELSDTEHGRLLALNEAAGVDSLGR